jgi:histidyl-tRNA synthetase
MYNLQSKTNRLLTLRPEATAPIARAYLQHGLHRLPQPVKLFTVAPMFRYARQQAGRYREHWQLSVEALGSDDPAIDAEVIQLYAEILRTLGVTDALVNINSVGDAKCRPAYLGLLNAWLEAHRDQLNEDALQKWQTSPLRVFDVKDESVRDALLTAPRITDHLCDECRTHFDSVLDYLAAYDVPYVRNPMLVRGLDYYTRTTFEFIPRAMPGEPLGAQSSLAGGGRYDGLVEELGGPPTPGIGFGAGLERLHHALDLPVSTSVPDIFFAFDTGSRKTIILGEVKQLRESGHSVELGYGTRSLKAQLEYAGKLGARLVVIIWAEGAGATIRQHGKDEWMVPVDALAEKLNAALL